MYMYVNTVVHSWSLRSRRRRDGEHPLCCPLLHGPGGGGGGGGRRNHAINKEEARRDREKGGKGCMYILYSTHVHMYMYVHVYAHMFMCMCAWLIVVSTNCGLVFYFG